MSKFLPTSGFRFTLSFRDAWTSLGNMSQEEAMKDYVEEIKKVQLIHLQLLNLEYSFPSVQTPYFVALIGFDRIFFQYSNSV